MEMAKAALCQPELTTVELDLPNYDDGSGVFYYPTCTRVNRCGGCCSHELLSCQGRHLLSYSLKAYCDQFFYRKFFAKNVTSGEFSENCTHVCF